MIRRDKKTLELNSWVMGDEIVRAQKGTPLVSVVVATRDRPSSLKRCIDSLLGLEYPCFEIVIVDNSFSDQTEQYARALQPHVQSGSARAAVRYIRERTPGLSRARNSGISEAAGEIIAFVDDDVVVDRAWLSGLLNGFRSASGVACVTGLVLPAERETPAQEWFEQFGGFSRGFERKIYDRRPQPDRSPLYPYNAGAFGAGASMAFSAEWLRKTGGFDEALGAGTAVEGGEDLDCFLRVVLSGRRLVYEPAAVSWHYHPREYACLRRKVKGYGIGLAAVITKALLHPATRMEVIKRLPRGILFLLSPRSEKNASKKAGFPRRLTWLELAGIACGPVAYLWSLRRLPARHGSRAIWRLRTDSRQVGPARERA